jgi:(2Fe-2S) ferredoxin
VLCTAVMTVVPCVYPDRNVRGIWYWRLVIEGVRAIVRNPVVARKSRELIPYIGWRSYVAFSAAWKWRVAFSAAWK